jgi:hypothetical protein
MPMFRRNVVSSSPKTEVLEYRYHIPSKRRNHCLLHGVTPSTSTMRKHQTSRIVLPFGMQGYHENMRSITMLFYQLSKASSHKVAKQFRTYPTYTGLFETIVGVLTTCHTQYT